jgi:hypothetical protein
VGRRRQGIQTVNKHRKDSSGGKNTIAKISGKELNLSTWKHNGEKRKDLKQGAIEFRLSDHQLPSFPIYLMFCVEMLHFINSQLSM